MTEVKVIALNSLITLLETRILDLISGRLDETLNVISSNPIPAEFIG